MKILNALREIQKHGNGNPYDHLQRLRYHGHFRPSACGGANGKVAASYDRSEFKRIVR